MFRLAATLISIANFLTFAPFLALIPAAFYALDRWCIYEANLKYPNYESLDKLNSFTKLTLLLPSIAIWSTLFIAIHHAALR
tara:strand:+ start:262 stop:507 length:246 start_codon:yes stop_codon:yes gene_type:complete